MAIQNSGVKAALVALRIYKMWLSPLMGGSCRFQPTCSQFMYEAVARFGVRRGVWLGSRRLLRCHPFSRRFGYDPVPEAQELEHGLEKENYVNRQRALRNPQLARGTRS